MQGQHYVQLHSFLFCFSCGIFVRIHYNWPMLLLFLTLSFSLFLQFVFESLSLFFVVIFGYYSKSQGFLEMNKSL